MELSPGQRLVIAILAALRAALIFGEADVAETWEPRWSSPRRGGREQERPAGVGARI